MYPYTVHSVRYKKVWHSLVLRASELVEKMGTDDSNKCDAEEQIWGFADKKPKLGL